MGLNALRGSPRNEPDPEAALDYFRRAADRRHPAAMFNFAAMIDDGKVPGRGAADAALYLYRALRAGDGTLLGLMQDEPQLFNSDTRKALQRKLSDFGFYDGAIDGLYGAGTPAAIRAAFGLEALELQGEAIENNTETELPDPVGETPTPAVSSPEDTPAEERPAQALKVNAKPEPGADDDVTPVLRPKQAERE